MFSTAHRRGRIEAPSWGPAPWPPGRSPRLTAVAELKLRGVLRGRVRPPGSPRLTAVAELKRPVVPHACAERAGSPRLTPVAQLRRGDRVLGEAALEGFSTAHRRGRIEARTGTARRLRPRRRSPRLTAVAELKRVAQRQSG